MAALTWWCELVVANFLLQTGERLSPINIVFTKFIYYISSPGAYLLTKKKIIMLLVMTEIILLVI